MQKKYVSLDYKSPSAKMKIWERRFREYVVSQDRAIKRVTMDLCLAEAGFSEARKPKCVFIFAGPTGVGKTHMVEVLSKLKFGEWDSYSYIDCSQYSEKHEVSRLIGSPPGYVGWDEDVALLSQDKIDSFGFYVTLPPEVKEELETIKFFKRKIGRPKSPMEGERLAHLQMKEEQIFAQYRDPNGYDSIILLDEIEKAHPSFFPHLMDIIDKARLSMGDGSITDFHNSYIFMTSNIGAEKIQDILKGKGQIGFHRDEYSDIGELIYRTTLKEMEEFFRSRPEFLGRIGKENVIVFQELARNDLAKILEMRLQDVCDKLSRVDGLKLYFSKKLKNFILEESSDPFNRIMGARPLQRLVKKHILEPLSVLAMKGAEDGGIGPGDQVFLSVKGKEVTIKRLGKRYLPAIAPMPLDQGQPGTGPKPPAPESASPPVKIPVESADKGGDVPVKIK